MQIRSANRSLRLVLAVWACLALWPVDAHPQTAAPAKAAPTAKAEKFFRTELLFGRSIPGGGRVSDEDWAAFLREIVTPRFPQGFTVLDGRGQYRENSGNIVSEPSHLLIILYANDTKRESRAKIEEIRTAYVQKFRQESVMRVDLPKSVRVSF